MQRNFRSPTFIPFDLKLSTTNLAVPVTLPNVTKTASASSQ